MCIRDSFHTFNAIWAKSRLRFSIAEIFHGSVLFFTSRDNAQASVYSICFWIKGFCPNELLALPLFKLRLPIVLVNVGKLMCSASVPKYPFQCESNV